MKGSLRQRSAGTWELTVDLGRDAFGRRQRRFFTVRGTKAQAQRKPTCLPPSSAPSNSDAILSPP